MQRELRGFFGLLPRRAVYPVARLPSIGESRRIVPTHDGLPRLVRACTELHFETGPKARDKPAQQSERASAALGLKFRTGPKERLEA